MSLIAGSIRTLLNTFFPWGKVSALGDRIQSLDTDGTLHNNVVGNVTSNLTGNVTGNVTGNTAGTHTGPQIINTIGGLSLDCGTLAALGSTQADAAPLVKSFTTVTASDSTKGVLLPPAAAGTAVLVKNTVAGQTLKVWPANADAVNALGANAAYVQAASAMVLFIPIDATTWYTLVSA
jgi:hypothetical protein